MGADQRLPPAEKLDETVEGLVSSLTDKSPFQMYVTKMTINQSLDASARAVAHGDGAARSRGDAAVQDAARGISAFLEKREPKWTGR